MSGNEFGTLFRVTTAGESHGPCIVAIVDGCPPGMALSIDAIQRDLDRRRPGQSRLTTPRDERDRVEVLSGMFEGRTTGTPIALLIPNQDARSHDYAAIKASFRPGHADFTWLSKFGIRDHRGGGRASARETAARVAAAAIARQFLKVHGISVLGYVIQVGDLRAKIDRPDAIRLETIEANPLRCPDPHMAEKMMALIAGVREAGDSIGGQAQIVVTGLPAGLGEPVFDKLKADLAKAILSIPAVTAFEYGSGIQAAAMRGSQHNDPFVSRAGHITTATNRHGGMLGGISSGNPILLRVTIKPASSISISQPTVDLQGQPTTISTHGRHDPCLLPRFVPVGEAMVLLTLTDHLLRWRAQCPKQARAALPSLADL